MAVSLVIAERSMAMRRTRFSGGSHASRKVRTMIAPSCSGPAATPRSKIRRGLTGSSRAASKRPSFEPK